MSRGVDDLVDSRKITCKIVQRVFQGKWFSRVCVGWISCKILIPET